MNNQSKKSTPTALLRLKAEALLKEKQLENSISLTEIETLKLLQELEVHKLELEMQNEELQLAIERAETNAEKYTNLYDFAPSGYFTINSDGEICELNFNAAKILGQDRSKLINCHFNLFIKQDSRIIFVDFLEKLSQKKIKQSCELPLDIPEKSTVFVHIEGFFAENEQKILLSVVDISERKQTELELFEAKERYRILVEESPVGVYQTDKDGKCIFTNRNWCKMAGLTQEEAMGDGWSKALHQDDIEEVFRNWQTMVAANGKWGQEYRMKNKEGAVSWVYGTASSMYNKDGDVSGYVGINTDISKLKETEQALKDSNNRWRTLLQDIPNIAVKGYDINEKISYWNKTSETFYGYLAEEAIGKKLTDLIVPEEAQPFVRAAIAEMFTKKTPIPASELMLKRKDGSSIPVFSSHTFVQTPGCEPELYCIDVDLSERKKAESELIEAKEKAVESDRLKSAFLANMSHEIRTPMNGILGFADLLKKPNLTNTQQQDYIRIIEKSGTRMLNIINSIVSISKIESGSMELDIKESNINEQIEYIHTFFKPEAESKGFQLLFKNALAFEDSFIHTDREKLFAVLTNLVKNAIKYTESGTIELGYTKKDKYLEFYVADTGVGIDDDRQEAIFERFIQADISDKKALQGAGLGLSISKAYVEMLGGTLWVTSKKGKGSIFYFTLPYNAAITAEIEITNSAENVDSDPKGLKILIVEDDEISFILIKLILKEGSREILHAKSGPEAIELCRNNPDIDLILMDIKIPVLNGYEATRQIREFNSDVIIIAQTAYGLTDDREKAMAAGCNEHLSKPLTKKKIFSMIQHFCNQ